MKKVRGKTRQPVRRDLQEFSCSSRKVLIRMYVDAERFLDPPPFALSRPANKLKCRPRSRSWCRLRVEWCSQTLDQSGRGQQRGVRPRKVGAGLARIVEDAMPASVVTVHWLSCSQVFDATLSALCTCLVNRAQLARLQGCIDVIPREPKRRQTGQCSQRQALQRSFPRTLPHKARRSRHP